MTRLATIALTLGVLLAMAAGTIAAISELLLSHRLERWQARRAGNALGGTGLYPKGWTWPGHPR